MSPGERPAQRRSRRWETPTVAVASRATTTIATAGNAAGISLDVAGQPIPVLGFGMLTAIFSVVGLVFAAILARTCGIRAARSSGPPWS